MIAGLSAPAVPVGAATSAVLVYTHIIDVRVDQSVGIPQPQSRRGTQLPVTLVC
jgi:hypothetical protein